MAAQPNRGPANNGSRPHIPHDISEDTIQVADEEQTPLLSSSQAETDPITIYVRILKENLPWYKRPSASWLFPIYGLASVSGGMLSSSIGQFQAELLCREYLNRHSPSNTTVAAMAEFTASLFQAAVVGNSEMVMLRPALECQVPEIQAYTAKTMAMIEVLGAIAGTLSIGYYASLSDKHGRVKIMVIGLVSSLYMMCNIIAMSKWWDQFGLPLMILGSLVQGLLGGMGVGGTMSLAYAADCTDPSRRSLIYSWLHAGLFMGLAIGSLLGGLLVMWSGSILTIVYIDIVATMATLLLLIFFVPESLPSKQPAHIQKLYERAVKHKQNDHKKQDQRPMAWHSHMLRSLQFFKPNGQNTNLILLGAISFLQWLALKGTFSVIILYTNRVFNWTEYEDGILFALSSTVRLISLLALLPVLVHLYNKHAGKIQKRGQQQQGAINNDNNKRNRPRIRDGTEHDEGLITDHPERVMVVGLEDPTVASSVEHLGEAALNLSDDEAPFEERRRRQSTADSIATWSTDRTRRPSHLSSSSNPAKKPISPPLSSSSAPSPARTKEKAASDRKLDTWIMRLGFLISSVTYVGYGLSTKGWHFYLWSSLHAVSIIAAPSLKSLLTALVEPSQFGAVLGAIQVVDSIAGIFSPVMISWVYALTVKTMPEFVWYCCAALTAVCAVLSFMVRQKQFLRPGTSGATAAV
ncbi:major facilitator superfamily domain-containing protein [Gamsiella multidivaricata]|uniref:major facilitator superfamily domain-containing protein n=1 Tax=Gamsiella multidivaricata TaxID=101098 RepID=UPI00221F9A13|nr:major facilitator superfamily domain-containing protein [Gamsiella multidivaricata]KAG0367728.1 hypothetical protein BGZ54_003372 [Gamsiella multidivaricata]KAI7832480.1 major facilitator superfamily domain-containing protein [Gamsiella multidivaricata]